MNKEAQLATMLTIGFAVALSAGLSCISRLRQLTHTTSGAPPRADLEKWLGATRHRLLKAQVTRPWPLVRLRLDKPSRKSESARGAGPLRPLVPPVPVRYNEGQMHTLGYIDNDSG